MRRNFLILALLFWTLPLKLAAQEVRSELSSSISSDDVAGQPITESERMRFRPYSPWGFAFFNWSTQNLYQTQEGIARFSSYNFLGVDYRLTYLSKVSLRQTFYLNGSGPYSFCEKVERTGPCVNRDSGVELGDIYLQYFRRNIALLPGDIGVLGHARIYLPMSDSAANQSQITEASVKMVFTRPWGFGVETNYIFEPHYNFYGKRGAINEFGTKVKGNKWGQLRHYFEVSERLGPRWGLSQQIGFLHEWFWAVPSQDVPSRIDDYLELKLSAFAEVAGVSFTAGLNNKAIFQKDSRDKRALKPYRSDETELSLMTFVRF